MNLIGLLSCSAICWTFEESLVRAYFSFYLWMWCVGDEFLFPTLSRMWQLSLSWYMLLTWPLTGRLDTDWYIDWPKYHFCPYTLLKHIKYKHSFNSPSNAPTVLLPQAKQDWIHFLGLPLTYRSMGGVCSPWILTMKCYIWLHGLTPQFSPLWGGSTHAAMPQIFGPYFTK